MAPWYGVCDLLPTGMDIALRQPALVRTTSTPTPSCLELALRVRWVARMWLVLRPRVHAVGVALLPCGQVCGSSVVTTGNHETNVRRGVYKVRAL